MKNDLKFVIQDLEKFIDIHTEINTDISGSTIGWQIDHTLKVITNITFALKNSDPSAFKSNFNFKRSLIFWRGSIPRGIAKAPKSVQTDGTIAIDDLKTATKNAFISADILNDLHPKSNFKHPYFGILNLKQSIKFLEIHSVHHLKIIQDILK